MSDLKSELKSDDDHILDNSHYERACDQAIAMCDGNLRSTIKALIMANEYLEAELQELQAAISSFTISFRRFNSAISRSSVERCTRASCNSFSRLLCFRSSSTRCA